ncbi:MAG: F0F1 ATP synthase subunit epsilon [Lachnospiraceae bacterium]|nr:F0F1 ATP synthase subunit epsilon [Lachnospiraceae bacterium]
MSGRKFFELKIYAEDGVFYEGPCAELILPCVDGEKAFLAHHEDAVYAVYNGELRFSVPEEEGFRVAVIGKGVAHFINNRAMVLAETAERPEDIDENRAREALTRAQEKMQRELSLREYRISQMAIARATARLKALSGKEQK